MQVKTEPRDWNRALKTTENAVSIQNTLNSLWHPFFMTRSERFGGQPPNTGTKVALGCDGGGRALECLHIARLTKANVRLSFVLEADSVPAARRVVVIGRECLLVVGILIGILCGAASTAMEHGEQTRVRGEDRLGEKGGEREEPAYGVPKYVTSGRAAASAGH